MGLFSDYLAGRVPGQAPAVPSQREVPSSGGLVDPNTWADQEQAHPALGMLRGQYALIDQAPTDIGATMDDRFGPNWQQGNALIQQARQSGGVLDGVSDEDIYKALRGIYQNGVQNAGGWTDGSNMITIPHNIAQLVRGKSAYDAALNPDVQNAINTETNRLHAIQESHHHKGFGFSSLLGLGASFLLGPQMMALAGPVAGGAITGAISSVIAGGDPIRGAITGGAGGAVSDFANGMSGASDTVVGNLTQADVVKAAGSGLIAGATGGNPLVSAGSSLAGSSVGHATGSDAAGAATKAATGLIGSHATGSNGFATTLPAITTSTPQRNTNSSAAGVTFNGTPGGAFSNYLSSAFRQGDGR